ncbi:hypothetical protein GGE07_006501 [Sinorhizobium terangae]|nr:hypothetical protein [Sinorhizobium terangae]
MLRWRLVCRSLLEPDCSDRRAAWHQRCSDLPPSRRQSDTLRLRNGRRSHFFAFRAFRDARSDADLADPPRPSPVSYDAMPRRAAAGGNIVHRQPNGTPIDRPVGPNRPSLRSTQPCALMWSSDWPASSCPQVAPPFLARPFGGRAAGTVRERIGDGPGLGARSRSPDACRSTSRTTRRCASATKFYRALFVQGRGALRRELSACLRTGRVLRVRRTRVRSRGKSPDSAAPTRTPMGCCVSTSRSAPSSASTAPTRSPPWPRPLMPDREKPFPGKRRQRRLTSCCRE